MTKRHLVIATRESPLAMQQAESVKRALQLYHPNLLVEILGMTTQADQRLDANLLDIGGKGLFVKELEMAILEGRADLAVHSMKDVPMVLPPDLIVPVIMARVDPRDAFVSNDYASLQQLPHQACVGTSSLRRQTQLRLLRVDVDWHNVRGNIHTRLKKLDAGEFSALILAAAGLARMGLQARVRQYLSVEDSLPAAGQGALGLECRADDSATQLLIAPLNDVETAACVTAERSLCRVLDGGCRVPLAAFAQIQHRRLTLRGLVANTKGIKVIRVRHAGDPKDADNIGKRAAEELLQQGAEAILREYR